MAGRSSGFDGRSQSYERLFKTLWESSKLPFDLKTGHFPMSDSAMAPAGRT
jgi:hypothetical protein